MASCGQCGREVGCPCNLIGAKCMKCYNESLPVEAPRVNRATRKKIVKFSKADAQPVTEFTTILQTPGISKQEKVRRINEILEKARQQL